MDPLSLTASIVAVLQLSNKATHDLFSAKGATKHQRRLHEEIRGCEGMLLRLLDILEHERLDPARTSTISLLEGPHSPFKRLETLFGSIRVKLAPKQGLARVTSSLAWPFNEKDISDLISAIQREESLLHLMLDNDSRDLLKGFIQTAQDNHNRLTELMQSLKDESDKQNDQLEELSTALEFSIGSHPCASYLINNIILTDFSLAQASGSWSPPSSKLGHAETFRLSTVPSEDVGVFYAFCNFSRREEQTPKNLLAALLRQTVHGKAQIDGHIKSLVFIVVDAVDELDTSRDGFLTSLTALSAKLAGKMSLFITSRIISKIAECLQGSVQLEIQASEVDISTFTQGQMSRLPAFVRRRPDLQSEISETIRRASQGMFLLAELHVASLVGSVSPKALRAALKRLPNGYDQAYKDVMWRIDHKKTESQRDLAYQVLEWLTRAKRALTSWELRHALAVELDSEEGHLDQDNLPEEDELVSACAGLVIVDKASGIIRLVHYTAQDFFEKTQEQFFPGDEGGITSICLKYLSFDGLRGSCISDEEYESRLTGNPFYSYAARHWGQHARRADMSKVLDSITHLLREPTRVDAMIQARFSGSPGPVFETPYPGYSQLFPRQVCGLHLAAYFGLEEAVRHSLVSQDSDLCEGTGMRVLSWAAANGHIGVIRILLEHNTVEAAIDKADEYGYTPLHVAARNGHTTTVEFLLEKGANPQAADRHGRTPLSWAAGEGHPGVVSALLAQDLHGDVDMVDEKGRSPLLLGAQRGYHTVVLLLLEAGAATDKMDNFGRTPLSWAVRYPQVVEILPQAKADMDAVDIHHRSPLSYAAARAYEMTVSLLLERGANANTTDTEGKTPLLWARTKGNEGIVSLLLQHGCRTYMVENQGLATTPEHIVGTNGKHEILDPRYRVVPENYFQPGEVGSGPESDDVIF
ncbi:AAA domain-containing protein [Fusarium keratoplasticum]|uniref:AAA domain-containing protein n=1 Tax=Fusarium keratoplasticum TaxID=1328300 RepID=A0ACC0QNY6_9HYPO|nr:AAA domain-containing protein [Fusarium keratoplasticum]KAI8660261.1 AAA domain-containing protein [Fusarium keratoplasticum]